MQFLVTDIEFDFDNDDADTVCNSELDVFFIASNFDRKEVTERHLGVWEAVSYTHLTLPTSDLV